MNNFCQLIRNQMHNIMKNQYITIIIISLFQEDNIFGTNASLTYGPQLQR